MSPIKFEENIKKKLEQRTIPVTEGTWEKLQERLEPEPKGKSSKLFWVMGIAASLVLVFWMSKDFFTTANIEPTFVEIPKEEMTPVKSETENVLPPEKAEILVAKEIDEIPTKMLEIAIETKNKKPIKEQPKLHKDEVLVAITVEEIKPNEERSFEDVKVQEVVAQIVAIKENNSKVSDVEIEELLAKAHREIEVKKLLLENSTTQSARTINPDVLLYEVEEEINKSFRDKVFEELKIQFKSVKNAVAQRND